MPVYLGGGGGGRSRESSKCKFKFLWGDRHVRRAMDSMSTFCCNLVCNVFGVWLVRAASNIAGKKAAWSECL